jgi:hypothetical protein
LVSPQKTFLMLISAWCILELLKAAMSNSSVKVVTALIYVNNCHGLVEPVLRCLMFEFQLAKSMPEFTVQSHESHAEWRQTVDLLIRQGLLVPAYSFEKWDLVLYLDRQGKREVFAGQGSQFEK